MFNAKTVFKISDNIVFRKKEEAYTLLEIDGDNLFDLQESSAFIWEQIVKGESYQDILDSLSDEYEDFGEEERASVQEFIAELIAKNIIHIS